jgi:hypothetical protein
MGSIILAILTVFAFYRLYKWTEKNVYHDPSNGTTITHREDGKTAMFEYMDIIDKENDNNSI